MATFTEKLPQAILPVKTVTLRDVVTILPENLKYKVNVWIGDKIARFGRTADNLLFLWEKNTEPTNKEMQYFMDLVKPLGIQATVTQNWKNRRYNAIRLYNHGKLIIDKGTMTYKELPAQVYSAPIITSSELLRKLPKEIAWPWTLYLTGGLVKNGWSSNDVDFVTFDNAPDEDLVAMRRYFEDILGWHVDIGRRVMPEREPVFLYEIYKNKLCQQ